MTDEPLLNVKLLVDSRLQCNAGCAVVNHNCGQECPQKKQQVIYTMSVKKLPATTRLPLSLPEVTGFRVISLADLVSGKVY